MGVPEDIQDLQARVTALENALKALPPPAPHKPPTLSKEYRPFRQERG